MLRVAVNGFGRIGRSVLRAWLARGGSASGDAQALNIVAINDLHQVNDAAHLLKYDSTHGRLNYQVDSVDGHLVVDQQQIQWLQRPDPRNLPWAELGVDIVFECSGKFASATLSAAHLQAGAAKVLVSAPAAGADRTLVFGVNHQRLTGAEKILSNASCTTNCLALVAHHLLAGIGIEQGMVTTTHCYTNDQSLQDRFHVDLRRARAVGSSIIPTTTGVVESVGEVLPELAGRLEGFSIRVPVQNVSLLDFTFVADRPTSVVEVNDLFRLAAAQGPVGLLEVSDEPLVSVDFKHHQASAVVDLTLTRVSGGNLVKVCAWYDNEWGFANRMLDVAAVAFCKREENR